MDETELEDVAVASAMYLQSRLPEIMQLPAEEAREQLTVHILATLEYERDMSRQGMMDRLAWLYPNKRHIN